MKPFSRVGLAQCVAFGGALAFMAAVAAGAATAAPDGGKAGYAVVHRWKLGGAGGWDYLVFDGGHQRLFVTRGDRADVVDPASGRLLGSIPGSGGAHGIALAPELGRGYMSNGLANSITEFDYATLAPLRTVPVPGANPDAIVYDPGTRRLLTFNGKSKDVSVFDARTLALVGRIVVPGKPEFARLDGHGKVFVNIETEPGQLVRIDIASASLEATWRLDGCNSPSGLAFDEARGRLFSVCDDKVMAVTDAARGKAIARVRIGEGPDAAEYDAARGLVFSSNGRDGTLSIVKQEGPDDYAVVETLATQQGARTMVLDPATGRVFLAGAEFAGAAAAGAARPAAIPGSFTLLVVAPR